MSKYKDDWDKYDNLGGRRKMNIKKKVNVILLFLLKFFNLQNIKE